MSKFIQIAVAAVIEEHDEHFSTNEIVYALDDGGQVFELRGGSKWIALPAHPDADKDGAK